MDLAKQKMRIKCKRQKNKIHFWRYSVCIIITEEQTIQTKIRFGFEELHRFQKGYGDFESTTKQSWLSPP